MTEYQKEKLKKQDILQIGDYVVINDLEEAENLYGDRLPFGYNDTMLGLCKKVARITNIFDSMKIINSIVLKKYKLDIDDGDYVWNVFMFKDDNMYILKDKTFKFGAKKDGFTNLLTHEENMGEIINNMLFTNSMYYPIDWFKKKED